MRDVKISSISGGRIKLRIYEGAVTTEDEHRGPDGIVPVTRYRRTLLVAEHTVALPEGADTLDVAASVLARNLGGHKPTPQLKTRVDAQRIV